MIHHTPSRSSLLGRVIVALLLISSVACSTQQSHLTGALPTKQPSQTSQAFLTQLRLTFSEFDDPNRLESVVSASESAETSSAKLLLAEAHLNRGLALKASSTGEAAFYFLRAAHFGYEGFFSPECEQGEASVCDSLRAAYSAAVLQVVLLTSMGQDTTAASGERYTLEARSDSDIQEFGDGLLSLTENNPATTNSIFGALGVGCKSATPGDSAAIEARSCSPLQYLLTFDGRTTEAATNANLAAYDTLRHHSIDLHGREIALSNSTSSAWAEIVAPSSESRSALSCLGRPDAGLPTALVLPSSNTPHHEWGEVLTSLTSNQVVYDHYNLCVLAPSTLSPEQRTAGAINSAIKSLLPLGTSSHQIVLIGDGIDNGVMVSTLKSEMREHRRTATPSNSSDSISVAASLVLPESRPIEGVLEESKAESDPSTSPRASFLVSDIQRFLAKLADDESGVFGHYSRQRDRTEEKLADISDYVSATPDLVPSSTG